VVAGLKGDSATQIVSGLKAGEQVVTSTGTTSFGSRTSTTGSTSAPGGGAFPAGGGAFPSGGFPGGAP